MNADYFIKKFEALGDMDVGVCGLHFKCALWHCGLRDYNDPTPESSALVAIFNQLYPSPENERAAVYKVNDNWVLLPQPTARQRILAALTDAKNKGF